MIDTTSPKVDYTKAIKTTIYTSYYPLDITRAENYDTTAVSSNTTTPNFGSKINISHFRITILTTMVSPFTIVFEVTN